MYVLCTPGSIYRISLTRVARVGLPDRRPKGGGSSRFPQDAKLWRLPRNVPPHAGAREGIPAWRKPIIDY